MPAVRTDRFGNMIECTRMRGEKTISIGVSGKASFRESQTSHSFRLSAMSHERKRFANLTRVRFVLPGNTLGSVGKVRLSMRSNLVQRLSPGRSAAWLARLLGVQEVGSSNLPGPTSKPADGSPRQRVFSFPSPNVHNFGLQCQRQRPAQVSGALRSQMAPISYAEFRSGTSRDQGRWPSYSRC